MRADACRDRVVIIAWHAAATKRAANLIRSRLIRDSLQSIHGWTDLVNSSKNA
jgi:hypothetical protein